MKRFVLLVLLSTFSVGCGDGKKSGDPIPADPSKAPPGLKPAGGGPGAGAAQGNEVAPGGNKTP